MIVEIPYGCGCQDRFGIPFWWVGEFTTHFRLPILVVGLNRMFTAGTHGHMKTLRFVDAGKQLNFQWDNVGNQPPFSNIWGWGWGWGGGFWV